MIVGVGTDILEIPRIKHAQERTPKLAERILTPEELSEYSEAREPERYLAKRFAAKEAVAKALGTGIGRGVSWQHLHIKKEVSGRPFVILTDGAKLEAEKLGIKNIHLSYSDERETIVAFAIAEG